MKAGFVLEFVLDLALAEFPVTLINHRLIHILMTFAYSGQVSY